MENCSVPRDRRVWYQCLALREQGWDVSVICPRRSGEAVRAVQEGITLHRFDTREASGGLASFVLEYGLAGWHATRLVLRVWREHPFDVLQACNPPDIFFPLGAVARCAGVPFLFDQHDLSPEMYTSRYGKDDGTVHRLLRLLEHMTYRTASHVVTTNQWYAMVAVLRGRLPPARVSVVRNGPDLVRMAPRPPRPALRRGRRYLAVFVGVMEPHDGVDLALAAIGHVIHELGRQDCHFAFLGDGESRSTLERQSVELGIDDYVSFTGWAEDDVLLDYLSTADIGLQPDPKDWRTDISTATKTVEYMAMGVPTVAFDLRETRATLGGGGLYAVANDPVHFAELVHRMLGDADLRRRCARSGRDRVEQELSWDVQKLGYLQVLEALLTSEHGVTNTDPAPAASPDRFA